MSMTVLFDLDGTLLPMDNDLFTKYYFKLLCKKLAPYGYNAQELIDGIWTGTAAMVKNDGSVSNETAFWKKFAEVLGDRVLDSQPVFEEFYANEFNEARVLCGYNEELVKLVHALKARGDRVVLATNPLFPSYATESRIRWAGFEPSDFELYTSYENIGYTKPNPMYYSEILRRIDEKPENTIMIGNDAHEDMIAETLGIKVFLLTDNLLNKNNIDISKYPHGGARELAEFLGLQ